MSHPLPVARFTDRLRERLLAEVELARVRAALGEVLSEFNERANLLGTMSTRSGWIPADRVEQWRAVLNPPVPAPSEIRPAIPTTAPAPRLAAEQPPPRGAGAPECSPALSGGPQATDPDVCCDTCGRPLRHAKSCERGRGPKCHRKHDTDGGEQHTAQEPLWQPQPQ